MMKEVTAARFLMRHSVKSSLQNCCILSTKQNCRFLSDADSSNADRMRFKWPRDNYMPSSSPYHMFPMISTIDDAKIVVDHMDSLSRKLLLQQLQIPGEEQSSEGHG